jgi:cell shape-determining protein MreC
VQNGEELKELTVTITLCEYRNLIRELSTYDVKIESLQEENNKIKEQLRSLAEIIVYKDPEIMNDIKKVIYSILGIKEGEVENGEM